MYSKLEKIPDSQIQQYFELLTNLPLEQLPESPRERQKLLALEVVGQYHGNAVAQQTQADLAAMVMQGDMSQTDLVPEFSLAQIQFPVKLFYLVSASGLVSSSSDARRQIQSGAVKLDGLKVEELEASVQNAPELIGKVLQVGKKKFVRLVE
jgi:tyrosyl-tRNA synthetase